MLTYQYLARKFIFNPVNLYYNKRNRHISTLATRLSERERTTAWSGHTNRNESKLHNFQSTIRVAFFRRKPRNHGGSFALVARHTYPEAIY